MRGTPISSDGTFRIVRDGLEQIANLWPPRDFVATAKRLVRA
jgi:hypothetical protein